LKPNYGKFVKYARNERRTIGTAGERKGQEKRKAIFRAHLQQAERWSWRSELTFMHTTMK
jgi:hypothetical protein